MLWEAVALLATVCVFALGRRLKRNYLGPYLIGLLYGLWWELSAEAFFDYSGFTIYIWRDVPLAIVLLWGVVIAGLLELSDLAQRKFKLLKSKLANCLVWDVLLAAFIGWTLEFSGAKLFGMWSYPDLPVGPMIAGVPARWLAGWIFVGLFVLAFARRYGPLIKWSV